VKSIIIIGCAGYLKHIDLHRFDHLETIGCNRILLHPTFRPDHLVIADRRPYIAELKSQRLKKWSGKLDLLLSTSLWNKKISCANTPVQRKPKMRHRQFRLHGTRGKMNWESIDKSFCSFGNTGGLLLQMAVVMGATHIGMTGVGIVRKETAGHFYKEVDHWGQHPSGKRVEDCFHRAKNELKKRGVVVRNLSLENEALEEIFPRYSIDKFLEEAKA
jgi:hypothetical protein